MLVIRQHCFPNHLQRQHLHSRVDVSIWEFPQTSNTYYISHLFSSHTVKSGVLRFGPQSDAPNSGAPPSILALQQVTQGSNSQQSTMPGQSPQRAPPSQLSANTEAVQQHPSAISTYTGSPMSSGQNLQGNIFKTSLCLWSYLNIFSI